jgi:hypothetical protein
MLVVVEIGAVCDCKKHDYRGSRKLHILRYTSKDIHFHVPVFIPKHVILRRSIQRWVTRGCNQHVLLSDKLYTNSLLLLLTWMCCFDTRTRIEMIQWMITSEKRKKRSTFNKITYQSHHHHNIDMGVLGAVYGRVHQLEFTIRLSECFAYVISNSIQSEID